MNWNEDKPVTATAQPQRALTPRQRNLISACTGIANDLDCGSKAEQHTAALLRLVVDAVTRGYEAELVALAVAWRRERELETET